MSTPWVSLSRPNPRANTRLFCFHYAGGSASVFRNWQASFPPAVEVCPVQLPGRASRLREKPFTDPSELVAAAAQALRPLFDRPFAFFGHGMGSLISYELTLLLRRENGITPRRLFVSGRGAPRIKSRDVTYDLPEDEFIAELRRLNGTPQEVLENRELMNLMLPLLRADFQICETYSATPDRPLDCPITAFGGLDDPETPREDIEAWREYTTAGFSLHMFPGGHFFLHEAQPRLTQLIARELSRQG